MVYLGAVLLGLIYLAITAFTNGSLGPLMEQARVWIQDHRPYSYIAILIVVFAFIFSLKLIHSWPKRGDSEDSVARFRRRNGVLED